MPTDKQRLDWLEQLGYPGLFCKSDEIKNREKPWFDSETPGSDYSKTLRKAIDAAMSAQKT